MNLTEEKSQILFSKSLIFRAETFARWAHEGQTRSDKKTPYISHPERVANILRYDHGILNDEILAIAWLHDTIEDCDVAKDDIEKFFGIGIARSVMQLSNIIEGDDHERKHGKVAFSIKHKALLEHCAHMGMNAKWVKLADRLDNIRDGRSSWKPKRTQRYAKAGYELVKALMPWPLKAENLACALIREIYEILPPDLIEDFEIVDTIEEDI